MSERFDAIVIGGGVNGLAAATALGKAGRHTLILEQAHAVGGQTRSIEFAPGFHAAPLGLDAGWMPPAVARGLGLSVPELAMADPPLTGMVAPGRFLELSADPSRAAQAIRAYSQRDAERWPDFVRLIRQLSGFLEHLYQMPALNIDATSPTELAGMARLALRFRRLGRRGMTELLRTMPMSIQELLDDWFESEALKAAVAAGGIQSIRQGPRSGGTAFVLLHHLVGAPPGSVRGRGYWRDGPDALTRALKDAARARGVTVRTGATAARILVQDYAVTGVALESGEEIAAPLVMSAADPKRTFLGLVDPVWLDPEFLDAVRNVKLRGSTAYVLYAVDALPDVAGLAGIVTLTPNTQALEQAYDATKYGVASEQPHVELTAPSFRWPALAPDAKHVIVARAQYAPYRLRDGQWDAAAREAFGDRVTNTIACMDPGFADRILHQVTLAPPDLERRFGLTEGAVTHGELTLDQILFMRPVAGWERYEMPIRGLYLCGAGAHPGPGIAGGPGWLAARQALDGARR